MIQNLSPHYVEVQLTAAAAKTAGEVEAAEDCYVFPLVDVESGDQFAGVLKTDKAEGDKDAVALAVGEVIYYNTTSKLLTNVATGAVLVGYVREAAIAGDAKAAIVYDGTLAYAKA